MVEKYKNPTDIRRAQILHLYGFPSGVYLSSLPAAQITINFVLAFLFTGI